MRRYISFIIILICSLNTWAYEEDSESFFRFSGDVKLLSHYVENGISHTNNSPALQGNFLFNFGTQFRVGLWGSNTSFSNSSEHLNLKLSADLKANFGQNSYLLLNYTRSQFYNSGTRSGAFSGIVLNFDNYKVSYQTNSNWEGTESSSKRYSFGLISPVYGYWKWNNEFGYNTPKADGYPAYLDIRSALGTNTNLFFIEGAVTATSASSQLGSAGGLFIILSVTKEL